MKHTKTKINNIYTYNNDIYDEGNINVPFSWEHKPGLSKVTHQNYDTKLVLKPPPCSLSKNGHRFRVEEKHIPIDLCTIQCTLHKINSFKMESRYQKELEDPFVEAYKKCTKSPFINLQEPTREQKNNGSNWSIRKYMHFLSCKHSCDVINHKDVYA